MNNIFPIPVIALALLAFFMGLLAVSVAEQRDQCLQQGEARE